MTDENQRYGTGNSPQCSVVTAETNTVKQLYANKKKNFFLIWGKFIITFRLLERNLISTLGEEALNSQAWSSRTSTPSLARYGRGCSGPQMRRGTWGNILPGWATSGWNSWERSWRSLVSSPVDGQHSAGESHARARASVSKRAKSESWQFFFFFLKRF